MIRKTLQRWFAAPVFPGEEDKTHLAAMFNAMLWGLFGYTLLAFSFYLKSVWLPVGALISITAALYMLRRGYVYAARTGMLLLWAGALSVMAWTAGGIQALAFHAYSLVIVGAALFCRSRFVALITGIYMLNGAAMELAAQHHLLPAANIIHPSILIGLGHSSVLIAIAVMVNRSHKYLQTILHRSQREITEHKQAEEALRESDEKLRATLFSMEDIVFVLDPEGRFLDYYQPQQQNLLYVPPEVFLGKPFDAVLPPHLVKLLEEAIQTVSRTNMGQHFDYPLEIGGQGYWFSARISRRKDAQGNFAGVTIVARNITERKQAEAEIRTLNAELEHRVHQRTTELETANRELKDFAYLVSHDLKAPLRAISRLVQWLKEDYATAFDAKGKEMADLLVERVKRMDALIDGILEYSRIGRIVGQEETIDLYGLLQEVIDTLSPPATVHIGIAQNLPMIVGDKIRIQQVFANLIGNAIKFIDKPQGEVVVGCMDDGAFWRFSVADNGPGIAPQYHEKIFQIFQTLQSRDELESTGIGLSIVKKIVEFYGGKIWVESQVGQGSTFWFTVPKMM
jgi:two-component system sensor kinase FixL